MRQVIICIAFTIVQFTIGSAQEIETKLSGSTTAQGFTVQDNGNTDLFTVRGNGNTGIGTSNPVFKLSLVSDGGILARGSFGSGAVLPSTSGSVLIWYPRKAAFRSGEPDQGSWDDSNIGPYSFGSGFSTIASGQGSSALGRLCSATGQYSTSIGLSSNASGVAAIAAGNTATASGNYSAAFGNGTTASGACSTALGLNSYASGDFSTAIGSKVSTNGRTGAMYLGDASSSSTRNAYADNHFYAVFDHGFSLFTDASGGNSYCVYLLNHSTSWLSCSDSTKKTSYCEADGEAVLDKFRNLRLGSWNFIGHDPIKERHYGPMAQEWFSAFGHDGRGSIGNDTSLASADVDGIAYIAIQALERRTNELRDALQRHSIAMEELRRKDEEIVSLKQQFTALKTAVDDIRRETAVLSSPAREGFSAASTR